MHVEKFLERLGIKECTSVKTPGISGIISYEYKSKNKIHETLYEEMIEDNGYLL